MTQGDSLRANVSPPLPHELQPLAAALADRYAIEAEIGRGGMAVVYVARDLRHERRVALKVLNPDLGAVVGAERFLAEIRVTANLQHPNLLPLFDSGNADGRLFYVMPFVEGESLRAKIVRDKQLPVDEALRITTAIASALDYAHARGVVHRDLKPENILLHGGQAIVADFGIALAVSNAGGARITQTGISLGTPQYMSPEQATGDRAIDRRSDIYSLGAVAYEMLAGEPPHNGGTSQSIIAKLLTEPVRPISVVRRSVPEHVDAAILRALEKVPADRFATASEFATALTEHGVITHQRGQFTGRRYPRWWPVAVAASAFAAGILLYRGVMGSRPTPAQPERQVGIALPDSLPVAVTGEAPLGIWQRSIAISSDGSTIAYVARRKDGINRLAIRRMDDPRVIEVAASEGAYSPFFSPDGRWIAFFTGTDLKKVESSGGRPVTLASRYVEATGGFWHPDGRIVVAADEGSFLEWVPAAGGKPEHVDTLVDQNLFPRLLPGGAAALSHDFAGLRLITFRPLRSYKLGLGGPVAGDSNASEQIIGHSPMYVASGHIVYTSAGDGTLMAVPFDAKSLKVTGLPAPVLEGVRKEQGFSISQIDISDDGTLVYLSGGNGNFGYLAMASPGAGGLIDTLSVPRSVFAGVHLHPDGRRAYARVLDATGRSARHMAVGVGTTRRWDFDTTLLSTVHAIQRVLADGRVLIAQPNGPLKLVSPETGEQHHLGRGADSLQAPYWADISARGDLIVSAKDSILVTRLTGGAASLTVRDAGGQMRLSPDGRWLAYRRHTGSVAVSPVPPTGAVYPVSTRAADQPRWSARGDRLYFRFGRKIWSAAVSTATGFEVGPSRLELDAPIVRIRSWSYDVGPDGRLLVVLGSPDESLATLNVVTGFDARLKRLVPHK